MRTWADLNAVETPAGIQAMPKDARGYPVPHTVKWINGEPDFRVIDIDKWRHAVVHRECGVCGQQLGEQIAFVGGPLSMRNRLFTDLPMHQACAEYALKVCPFIAMPTFGFLKEHAGVKQGELQVISAASSERPTQFGLGLTDGYQVARVQGMEDDIFVYANEFSSVQWWRHGEVVDDE